MKQAESTGTFGRYRVVRRLGAGAMGEVFLAHDDLLAREVAVKTLRPLGLGGLAAELFRGRFLNEARAVAALAHPHIVRVFDLGFEGETPYLVMEVVAGRSLRERIQNGPRLAPDEARALGIQIARALDAAHRRGIVHRDVKPANILEAEPGVWKLADFGVAHVPDSDLTVTGQFMGSPAYAAPEALLGGDFSPSSDVYGLAATLYEALGGTPPYGEPGRVSAAARARGDEPRPLAALSPLVPADIAGVVQTALARDPRQRPTAADVATALSGSIAPPAGAPRPGRRGRWPWAAAGLAAVVLLVGLAVGRGGQPAPMVKPPVQPPITDRDDREPEKRWEKINEKLGEGKLEEAARELRKVLEHNPDDEKARALLDAIEEGRVRTVKVRHHDD